ncbi:MAG: hypothetical protein OEV40_24230 [Acidimicrobiia bacterium]|nr:hypothetical protein [Acidimicrobiia bacterium]
MGNISTAARADLTALGDEVNEAARIEACATGGRILASKPLAERLSEHDAADTAVDPDSVVYTQLADLDSATDRARRDAPAIAVCELEGSNRGCWAQHRLRRRSNLDVTRMPRTRRYLTVDTMLSSEVTWSPRRQGWPTDAHSPVTTMRTLQTSGQTRPILAG